MNNKDNILLISICISVILAFTLLSSYIKNKDKYEIHMVVYTENNVYVIDGLTVTNDRNSAVLRFEDMESMSTYIQLVSSGRIDINY